MGDVPKEQKATEGTPLVKKAEDDEEPNKFAVILSICLLISIAVLKSQLTAFLFSTSDYPTAYSFYSCLVTCVMLLPVFIIRPSQWGMPYKEMFTGPTYSLTLIIIFTTFDLGLTNIALSELSVALQQCIAATNPFWTLMIESILYKKFQHALVYCAVLGVVAGAILTSVAQIHKLSVLGVWAAIGAVLCSASKYVFAHAAFKAHKGHMGPLALLFWVDLLMIPIYVVWILANGELVAVYNAHMSAGQFWQFTGTAALGGVRALSQYIVLIFVTATSMSTANILTQILNILLSMTWQSNVDITPALISGIVVVICFSSFYTYLKSDKNACGGVMVKKEPATGGQGDLKEPLPVATAA